MFDFTKMASGLRFGCRMSRTARKSVQSGMALGMERLECRQMPANIVWDGGVAGTGTDFNAAANWVGDVLPGAADIAVINTAGPTITLTAARSVTAVQSSRALEIGSSGNLTTTGVNQLTASVSLIAGTLTGGTWNFTGGTRLVSTSSGGTLNNVTMNQDLVLDVTSANVVVQGTTTFPAARMAGNATYMYFAPGYTLNTLISVEGATAGGRNIIMAYGGTGTFTMGASGVVRIAAGSGGDLSMSNSSVSTLVNSGLITNEAAGRTLTINNTTFTNNGTASATAGTLSISATNATNSGTISGANATVSLAATTWSSSSAISVSNGTLTFGGAWSSTGTVTISSTIFNVGGTFTTAGFNFAGFSRTGGTVNLTGTLTNTTLALNTATGTWNLVGGTIVGGVVNVANGESLVTTSSGGTLNNVTINQDLVVSATSANVIIQGTTTFPAARLAGNSTYLYFAPGFVLNTLISVEGATAGGRNIIMAYGGSGTFTVGASGVIRLAAGSGGDLSMSNSSISTLVNNGLITNEATGRTITINNSTFTNNGTTSATAGTLSISATNATNSGTISGTNATVSFAATTWASSSAISVSNGTLTFGGAWSSTGTVTISNTTFNLGGAFTSAGFNFAGFSRTGGTVNLTGTLTNTTLTLNTATGSWNFVGGTIVGGVVNFANGQSLVMTASGGTLNNVTMNHDLVLDSTSANVIIQGTTTFAAARMTGNATYLYFAPGYTLNTLISVEGATTGGRNIVMAYGGTGTFTVGATGVIRVAAGSGGDLSMSNSSVSTLVNNGLISSEATGRALTINNSVFTNNGTAQATAGTLALSATNWTNPGTIVASNAILNFAGSWSSGGTLTITNSTLNLGGTFTSAGFNFAGFTRTGGTVNLTGTLTNTTLTLNTATGSWNLLGGTIVGGVVNFANGQSLVTTSSGGTLNNVTMNQDLVLEATSANVIIQGTTTFAAARMSGNATYLYLAPGFVLNTLISIEGATVGGRNIVMAYGGAGTITVGASGVIRVAAGSGGDLSMSNSSAATLVNNGLISSEATGRTLTLSNSVFTNNGTAQATAGVLALSAANWTSSGTISASNATLNFAGSWSSGGTLTITNSTLNMGGSFTSAGFNFAGFTRTGGTVNLTGTLTNTTLTLNTATGSWNLLGGTIVGGVVNFANGQSLVTTSSGGTLNNVTMSQDLVLEATSANVIIQGTTTFPAARMTGNATYLYIAPGFVLNNLISVEGATAGGRNIVMANGGTGTFTVGATGVIRVAAGSAGDLAMSNSSASTFVNNGLISSEGAGRLLSIQNSVFTNNGTARATAGTLSLGAVNWTNPGTITGTGGTVSLGGTFNISGGIGTFATANVRVQVTGTIPNAGQTIPLTASTGSWYMAGGTISGGTITFAGGASLRGSSSGGTLLNVTVSGELRMDSSSAYMVLQGTTTFVTARLGASAAALYLAPGVSVGSQVLVDGAESGTRSLIFGYGGPTTVTIQPGSAIRVLAGSGGGLNISYNSAVSLINNGLISSEASNVLLTISTIEFANNGTLRTQNGGSIQLSYANWSNGGVLDLQNGAMAVHGAGTFTDPGVINLGPGGLLNVYSGDGLVLASTSIVNVTIGGTALNQYGRIVVHSGNANLAGVLNITMDGSYQPPIVSTFDIVTVVPGNRSIVGGFSSTVMPPPGVDGKNFMYNDNRHIIFAFSSLADYNSDTIVDLFDYLDFVNDFANQTGGADFNNDGVIDFFDYLDFLVIFSRF